MATMKLVKEIARVSFMLVSTIREVGSRAGLSESYSRMDSGGNVGRALFPCGVFFAFVFYLDSLFLVKTVDNRRVVSGK